jgi:hypothetical protein
MPSGGKGKRKSEKLGRGGRGKQDQKRHKPTSPLPKPATPVTAFESLPPVAVSNINDGSESLKPTSLAALGTYDSSSGDENENEEVEKEKEQMDPEESESEAENKVIVDKENNEDDDSDDDDDEEDVEENHHHSGNNNEVVNSTTSKLPQRRRKPRPCKYFVKGACRQGDSCKFSHEKVNNPPVLFLFLFSVNLSFFLSLFCLSFSSFLFSSLALEEIP